MRNITIDDTNLTAIAYAPTSCGGSATWTISDLNNNDGIIYPYNGTYRYCDSQSPTATFKFTGVAAYYFSPGFVEQGTVFVTVDDFPSEEVNVTTPTGKLTISSIRWSKTGLPNAEHTLIVRAGLSGFVDVDAFTYTALDADELPASTTSPSSLASPVEATATAVVSAGASQASQNASSTNSFSKTLGIGLGIAFGVTALVLIAIGAYLLGRRSRSRRARESEVTVGPSFGGGLPPSSGLPPSMADRSHHHIFVPLTSYTSYPKRSASNSLLPMRSPQSRSRRLADRKAKLPPPAYSIV